jgi:hypothetical protein
MSSETLTGSVGLAGTNRREDVVAIQSLLSKHGFSLGRPDGICGPKTIAAIKSFQQGFMRNPDGRIDPHGISWNKLTRSSFARGAGAIRSPFLQVVPRPEAGTVNIGLHAVDNAFMESKLGKPRESYSGDCQPVTNARLKRNMAIQSVGTFSVQGLSPAVNSLRAVLQDVAREQPDVYKVLGTAGMLCCRYQRGSTKAISNHSWGTAIDLTIAGVLDIRGDGKVQYGLTLIAPIFNRHGWYWGAAFHVEDGMHFEAGRALVERWSASVI